MNDVNLALFQFDYDLTWMGFFLNAGQGIYSRFGGRAADDAEGRLTVAGLKNTMRRVLSLHQKTPEEAAPAPVRPKYPQDLFVTKGTGCMHCHHVWEGLRKQAKKDGTFSRALLDVYPLPENIGLEMNIDAGNRVARVQPASPSARAGLKPGDVLDRIALVKILAQGDMLWALHNAPAQGRLPIAWLHDGQPRSAVLDLPAGWKQRDTSWRRSLRKK